MNTIKGDITQVEKGYIFQQVNCQNAMGSGVARAIANKWPQVKEDYHKLARLQRPLQLLGQRQLVWIKFPELCVVNVFGQLEFGSDGRRYTDYAAIKQVLNDFSSTYNYNNGIWGTHFRGENCYFPKLFGCGLGGGDWKIMEELIKMYLPLATIVEL